MSSHELTPADGSTRKRTRPDAGQGPSKRQRSTTSKTRQKIHSIAMMWSPDVLNFYGSYTEKDQSYVSKLYQCAKKYRRHNVDFVPQANFVLWLKYCAQVSAIDTSRASYEAVLDTDLRLQLKDLDHLIAMNNTKPIAIHGFPVTIATASEHQHIIKEWTESVDGHVKVHGETSDLRTLQPLLWHTLLLAFNGAGLLSKKDGQGLARMIQQTPSHSTTRPAQGPEQNFTECASTHCYATAKEALETTIQPSPCGNQTDTSFPTKIGTKDSSLHLNVAPETLSIQMEMEATGSPGGESNERQTHAHRAAREETSWSHVRQTWTTHDTLETAVSINRAPSVDNTNHGFEERREARHLSSTSDASAATRLDAIGRPDAKRASEHSKSKPTVTADVQEANGLSPSLVQYQRRNILDAEDTSHIPIETVVEDPHCFNSTMSVHDLLDRVLVRRNTSIDIVKLEMMVRHARRLESKRETLTEQMLSLESCLSCSRDKLTGIQSRFHAVSAECARRDAELQELLKKAAVLEDQASEQRAQAETIQKEAELQEAECKKVTQASNDAALKVLTHYLDMKTALERLGVDGTIFSKICSNAMKKQENANHTNRFSTVGSQA